MLTIVNPLKFIRSRSGRMLFCTMVVKGLMHAVFYTTCAKYIHVHGDGFVEEWLLDEEILSGP